VHLKPCSRNNLIKFSSSKGLFPQPDSAKQTHSKTPTQQQACLVNCTLCDRNNNLSLAPLVCLSNYKSRRAELEGFLCAFPRALGARFCRIIIANTSAQLILHATSSNPRRNCESEWTMRLRLYIYALLAISSSTRSVLSETEEKENCEIGSRDDNSELWENTLQTFKIYESTCLKWMRFKVWLCKKLHLYTEIFVPQ
jgi:hypothetical protein